jgi:hypothetical protein
VLADASAIEAMAVAMSWHPPIDTRLTMISGPVKGDDRPAGERPVEMGRLPLAQR